MQICIFGDTVCHLRKLTIIYISSFAFSHIKIRCASHQLLSKLIIIILGVFIYVYPLTEEMYIKTCIYIHIDTSHVETHSEVAAQITTFVWIKSLNKTCE